MSDQKEVLERIENYLRQLAPHALEREAAQLLKDAAAQLALKEKDAEMIAGLVDALKFEHEWHISIEGAGGGKYKPFLSTVVALESAQPTADKFMAEYAVRVLNEATERIVMELEGLADDVAMTQVYRTGRQMVAEYCNPAGRTDGGAK